MRIHTQETIHKVGQKVEVAGWVSVRRNHGKIIFIDLRDESGILQLVFTPQDASLYEKAERLRPEWVVRATGIIAERPAGMVNPELSTGEVELSVETLEVLSEAKTPPFDVLGDGRDIDEEMRLKYRYLDLRRPRLQKNLRFRARFLDEARQFLIGKKFVEIETPLLTKSTPEGSRDFLVPSRLQPGKFYALPQSPQQYKQLLMASGFERYFQLARALRDEDLRADRALEHTQIDLEMSFVTREDVMGLAEGLVTSVSESLGCTVKENPFPVISYQDAVQRFGADKFDLRSEEEKSRGVLAFSWVINFPLFEKIDNGGWTYSHNPFTGPRPEDEEKLLLGENIKDIISLQYDLVCNGHEIGGGGIRINKSVILKKVFEIIGHDPGYIEKEFGHMLEAFTYGTPPHGGIALGVERIVAILTEEDSIRETQAFPTTSGGRTAVMDAPSEVETKQLKELHIKIEK